MGEEKKPSIGSHAKIKYCAYCGHTFGKREFFNYSLTLLNNQVKCSKCRKHNHLEVPQDVLDGGCGCVFVILVIILALLTKDGFFILVLALIASIMDFTQFFPYIFLVMIIFVVIYWIGDFFSSMIRWSNGSIVAVSAKNGDSETMLERVKKFLGKNKYD